MRRSHTRPSDRDTYLRFKCEIADALAHAGDAWARFLCDCCEADRREGYQAFWVGPLWFARELGEPFLNEAGRFFEATYWIEGIRAMGVLEKILEQSGGPASICDLLHPIIESHKTVPGKITELSADHRALAYVQDLVKSADRHYQYEIELAAQQGTYELLGLGTHTPVPQAFKLQDTQPTRNPAVELMEDSVYWKGRYPAPIVFVSDAQELMSRRWYSTLIPLIAPEFELNKTLSTPQSVAYVLPSEGDWVWAILVDTTERFNFREPELGLLWRMGKRKNKGILMWQPPPGHWYKEGAAYSCLYRAVRGFEVNLIWLVRHYKRLIRFYQPYLIEYFATRGETLLPAFTE